MAGPRPQDPAYPAELRTIGDHVQARRLDLGLLQREAAAQMGVYPETIRNWELGWREPALRSLPAIVRFLGYSPLPQGETLGERIVGYRKLRGVSRERLARELRIDPTTLWRWESGRADPSPQLRHRLPKLP